MAKKDTPEEEVPRNLQREVFTEVKHPDVEGTGKVPFSALYHYEKLGWRVASKNEPVPADHELPPAEERLSAKQRRELEKPAPDETEQTSSKQDDK